MANLVKTFTGSEDFGAMSSAEDFLRTAGFSIGSTERGSPRGIMFGDCDISKWRNLSTAERKMMHGQMVGALGSMRSGPITVTIFEQAPQEAKCAFHQTAIATSD